MRVREVIQFNGVTWDRDNLRFKTADGNRVDFLEAVIVQVRYEMLLGLEPSRFGDAGDLESFAREYIEQTPKPKPNHRFGGGEKFVIPALHDSH